MKIIAAQKNYGITVCNIGVPVLFYDKDWSQNLREAAWMHNPQLSVVVWTCTSKLTCQFLGSIV
jgi:hypothetical protein